MTVNQMKSTCSRFFQAEYEGSIPFTRSTKSNDSEYAAISNGKVSFGKDIRMFCFGARVRLRMHRDAKLQAHHALALVLTIAAVHTDSDRFCIIPTGGKNAGVSALE